MPVLTALADFNDNNNASVVNRLEAFTNEVEAQRGRKITDAQAKFLIAATLEIIDAI